jgi:hypothetical protein
MQTIKIRVLQHEMSRSRMLTIIKVLRRTLTLVNKTIIKATRKVIRNLPTIIILAAIRRKVNIMPTMQTTRII